MQNEPWHLLPERLAAFMAALDGADSSLLEQAVGLFPSWDWELAARTRNDDVRLAEILGAIARGRRDWAPRWQASVEQSDTFADEY